MYEVYFDTKNKKNLKINQKGEFFSPFNLYKALKNKDKNIFIFFCENENKKRLIYMRNVFYKSLLF